MLYRALLRPILFSLDAERAHELALRSASVLARSRLLCRAVHDVLARPRPRPVTALGLTFPNPVGLAGGMDKNAVAPLAWWAFGFGFAELGTVTPRPQPGNERPRMFRFPGEYAIVNRMGFNNDGAAALAARLARLGQLPFPVGVSVGKNKDTPAERSADDFAQAAAVVAPHADFVTVNVSSPNTPGLRALQNADDLGRLVEAVRAAAGAKPVLVKVAPELAGDDLAAVLDAALTAGTAGVIATNTLSTAGRPELPQGGLSGRPLRELALRRVAEVRRRVGDRAAVIGCGGIDDAASARAMLDAGADLVQLYTGLVYEGPFAQPLLETASGRPKICEPRHRPAVVSNCLHEHRQWPHPYPAVAVERPVHDVPLPRLAVPGDAEHLVLVPLEVAVSPGLNGFGHR